MDVTRSSGRFSRQSAFTLVELLVTLAVAVILVAVVIPAIQRLQASNRLMTSVNTMVGFLQATRSEAIMRGEWAVLCPSTDGVGCTGGLEWHHGFILFVDNDRDKKRDDEEELLRVFQPESNVIRITSTDRRRRIRYMPDGTSPGSNVTITFCDSLSAAEPRAVILSNAGRPRVSPVNSKGAALVCS